MSTVLWANTLIGGVVESDESDKYALYSHSKKLNRLTNQLKVMSFVATHDFTDFQFNISDDDLPEGMESTDELMAEKGVWVSGADAVDMLESLISHISTKNTKFGLLRNDSEAIIAELKDSLVIANRAKSADGMFNFSVVM